MSRNSQLPPTLRSVPVRKVSLMVVFMLGSSNPPEAKLPSRL